MEVDDVSHVRQLMGLFETQKAALQAASKRKGERPKDRKSRDPLVNDFMSQYIATKMMLAHNEHHIHQSFIVPPYQPSIASLADLKQLLLKDLQLETHHRSFYALLRVKTSPITMTAVVSIVEDENRDGAKLQLYQQKDDDYRKGEEAVRINNVCIVKEPYFKVMNDGCYGLRVDHVSDIIWLSPDDDMIPLAWRSQITGLEKGAEGLKISGNGALKAGKVHQAVEFYTLALQYSKTFDESRIIKLNRSLANLKLGHYDHALEDAGELTASYQKSEKGFYRAARSLYELGRFQECHDVLKLLLAEYPHCVEARNELSRTEHRLREQEHGDFDFKTMYEVAKKNPPRLGCATYIGPVSIKTSEGRGRGLFTKKDVLAGELLLCEKAFAYCWADSAEGNASSKTSLLINTHTNRAFMGTQADMITDIVQKMYRNPSLMPAFTSLHHGDYEPVEQSIVDGVPVVDTFTPEKEKKDKGYHTCGLFINASYINHSCDSNARRSFIGDMQIVRASRNLPAGTEITFWYRMPDQTITYEQSQKKLENWRFKCTCTICEQNERTKKNVKAKRAALLQDLMRAFQQRDGADLAKAERLLATIEKTYLVPATEVPRLALWDPYLLLTRFYKSMNQQDKAIQTGCKVLQSLGFVIKRQDPSSLKSPFEVEQWGLMKDHVVETWVHLWTAYAQVAPDLCKKAEEYAKIAYKVCVGEDETFELKYGKLAHQAMFEGLNLGQAFQNLRL